MLSKNRAAGRKTEAAESKTEATKTEAIASKCKTEAIGSKCKTETTGSKTEATGTRSKTEPIASVTKTSRRKVGALPGGQIIEITLAKTRTAMLMTLTGDLCRSEVFIAIAMLNHCGCFPMRRNKSYRNLAVCARSLSHHVSYGRHTWRQSMEASKVTAMFPCASPHFSHMSFEGKSGDWLLAASMNS